MAPQVNHGFGPISESRKQNATIASITFIILYALMTIAYRWYYMLVLLPYADDVGLCSAITSSLILGEVLRRVALYVEEFNHVEKRYNGNIGKAFVACFQFPNKSNSVSSEILFHN